MSRKLINLLPEVIAGVEEIKAVIHTEQVEIDTIWDKIDQDFNNQFIESANEKGIARQELMLKIKPPVTDDLEVRRFRVHSRYNEQPPYTYYKMLEKLKALCGENGVKAQRSGLILTIKVELNAKGKVDEVRELLSRMVPANVVVDVSLLYNQHITLGKFKHNQLKRYTHQQLREDVII